jgi:ATP-dependent helicase/nuclease subunit A
MVFIESLVQANIITSQDASSIDSAKIAAFFTSQTGKRVLASSEVFKEAPFILKTIYEEKEVMVQGTLDCYFKEAGCLVIVDYKSNYVDMTRKEEEMERMIFVLLLQKV